jgi:hypothetical protein
MTDTAELLIPIFIILVILAGVAISIYGEKLSARRRELLHKERLAAIEKGIELPQALLAESEALGPNAYLLRGLTWLFTGVAIVVFFLAVGSAEGNPRALAASALGLIPAGVGLAYLLIYRKNAPSRPTEALGSGSPGVC